MGNVYQMSKPVSAVESDRDLTEPNVLSTPHYLHGADVPKTTAQRLDEKLAQAKINHMTKTQQQEIEHRRYTAAKQFRLICKDYFHFSWEEAFSLSLEECRLLVQKLEKESDDHRLMLKVCFVSLFGCAVFLGGSFRLDIVDWVAITLRIFLVLCMTILGVLVAKLLADSCGTFCKNLKKLQKFYGEDYFPYDEFQSQLKHANDHLVL